MNHDADAYTTADLRASYRRLAEDAPDRATLGPFGSNNAHPRRRRRAATLIAVAVIVILAIVLGLVRPWSGEHHARPAVPKPTAVATSTAPPAVANYPTEYWFGPNSLPGYTLDTRSLDPTAQNVGFVPKRGTLTPVGHTALTNVALFGFAPTAAQLASLRALPKATLGGHVYYFGRVGAPLGGELNSGPALVWALDGGRWAALQASVGDAAVPFIDLADLAALAATVRPVTEAAVAVAEVGYVPAGLRFESTADYFNQGTMEAPDGTVGTGYRDLAFIDRSVPADKHATLDIDAVIAPATPLATATANDLPTFNNGPWRKTTVAGHTAWVAPHDVLIQWGGVQIGVSSTRITGDDSTPLLDQATLLKVAESLMVVSTTDLAQGFPLAAAVPPAARR